MMMLKRRKLLVGSVYYSSERNPFWFKTQLEFLKQTTTDFELAIYLNREHREEIFQGAKIIGKNLKAHANASQNHAEGLQSLVNYFLTQDADYYLILDSDGWPIVKNWQTILLRKMSEYNKEAAAVVRFENAEMYPHPCACYCSRRFLIEHGLDWRIGKSKSALGTPRCDPGTNMRLHDFLPLLRTNVWNPHPCLAGIYAGLFYHHGCGSRKVDIRLHSYYLDMSREEDLDLPHRLYADLARCPEGHIRQLTSGRSGIKTC